MLLSVIQKYIPWIFFITHNSYYGNTLFAHQHFHHLFIICLPSPLTIIYWSLDHFFPFIITIEWYHHHLIIIRVVSSSSNHHCLKLEAQSANALQSAVTGIFLIYPITSLYFNWNGDWGHIIPCCQFYNLYVFRYIQSEFLLGAL